MDRFLIIGLGNIGDEYRHTRHNIGFDVVNAFVLKQGGMFQSGRLADFSEVKWKGKQFICIKPTTYMNLSGKAFKYWMEGFGFWAICSFSVHISTNCFNTG